MSKYEEWLITVDVSDALEYYHTIVKKQPIVRCRDCKRYDPNAPSINSCRFELEGYVEWRSAAPDGFCAWGERREK